MLALKADISCFLCPVYYSVYVNVCVCTRAYVHVCTTFCMSSIGYVKDHCLDHRRLMVCSSENHRCKVTR